MSEVALHQRQRQRQQQQQLKGETENEDKCDCENSDDGLSGFFVYAFVFAHSA